MFRAESKVENDFVADLEEWGFMHNIDVVTLKLNLRGRKGWPDRLVMWEGGHMMFIEFKRPGEEPRRLQVYVHKQLRALGFEVQVHDNTRNALDAVEAKIRATTTPNKGDDARGAGGRLPPLP